MGGTSDTSNPWVDEAKLWLQNNQKDQKWLAEQVGSSDGTISNYFTRRINLSDDMARRMAPAFGMTQATFFKWCGLITEKIEPETEEETLLINNFGELTAEQRANILLMMRAYKEENAKKQRSEGNVREAGIRTRSTKAKRNPTVHS